MAEERGGGYVVKRIRIPEDDADWFDKTYPMYGAWTWFIQAALAKFRQYHIELSVNPEDLIDASVPKKLEEIEE